MLTRPALREYRTWVMDSRNWNGYLPRNGDIIIATYPKCGTTWMQRIINLLIFQKSEVQPLDRISPWIDMRISAPVEETLKSIELQSHTRAMKSHLPLDGLPLYDEVRYIHVGRDGRDAVMSFHNHGTGFKEEVLSKLDAVGLADKTLARAYPRLPADPAEYFHKWLGTGAVSGQSDGYQFVSFFEFEKTYWAARHLKNLLFVHYADLKADLEAEMRRIAAFLEITVPETVWPSLVLAAGFNAMKQQGAELMPRVTSMFNEGKDRFFNKGQNGRWKGVFTKDDLDAYEAKLATSLSDDCIRWLEEGRRSTDDPINVRFQ